jgi:eukaryotic-like serine/threonine-protein kinase
MPTDVRDRLQAVLGDAYAVERELGAGGMSRLFLATERSLDRRVVVKLLPPELASEVSAGRFVREVQVTASLTHPHVLPVLAAGGRDGLLYYVMPYVEGESLRQRLRRERQLPIRDAIQLLREIGDALAHAHRKGVVHRDVKPENILLEEGHAVLADFGIARAVDVARAGAPSAATGALTGTGTSLGTPGYMAPEQLAGDPYVDARVDVYALGVVAYEMLTGTPPFSNESSSALAKAHLVDVPRPVTELRPETPKPLAAAILKALAKEPDDRFQTAAEFRDALEPRRSEARPGAFSRRRVVAGGAVAAVLAAVAALAFAYRRPHAALDVDLLAVVPFNVLEPSLQLWREGMVDLLSRNLDGAGPLRTVSPTIIVRRWTGSADRSSSAELARRLGARLVIFGTLVRSGADSVRVEATLLDAGSMRVLAEARLQDQAQHLDRLSDSLTLTLLRELGRGQPFRAVRLAGFGRTSLPALKAFLRGEQHFRRTDMDSARLYYERAVTLDSTFAVAYQRLGRVAAWQISQWDSLSALYALRAGALNRGIAPRESLLIAADSLYAALSQWAHDPAFWSHATRHLQTLELAAKRYPDDPEVWNDLGEARFHYGPFFGGTAEQARAAFARAITLDSTFGLPYEHAVELALNLDGLSAGRSYARMYLATNPGGEPAVDMRIVALLLDAPAMPTPALEQLLDTIPVHGLQTIQQILEGWPDSAETSVRVERSLVARRAPYAEFDLCRMLILRGHVREAVPCAIQQHDRIGSGLYAEVALLGAVPPESARVTLAGDLRTIGRLFPPWLANTPTWAAIYDTALLREAVRRGDSTLRVATEPALRRIAQVKTYSARAYLALARRDTADALRQFLAMPDSLGPWKGLEDLTTAQLLAARGRDRDALRLLRVLQPNGSLSARTVLSALEHGRVAERLGERREAAQAYQYVADMWMHADPGLQRYVREAHVALARLTTSGNRAPSPP